MKPFPAADKATCPVFAAALHRAKARDWENSRAVGPQLAEAAKRQASKPDALSRVVSTARSRSRPTGAPT